MDTENLEGPAATLVALQRRHPADLAEALAFYDSLPAAAVDALTGAWRGEGLDTGNPLDGVLETMGWHGKRFEGAEGAHPLVMDGPRGRYSLDPAFVPMGSFERLLPLVRNARAAAALRRALPLLATRKPRARVRAVEYRGVVTATMSYDALPINDHFRSVDADTLLGAMDLRGLDAPFLFVLRREG